MVELLITLVLLGIVAAIAVPSFRGWVDNSNLKAAARTLSSDIAYMRDGGHVERKDPHDRLRCGSEPLHPALGQ